MLLAGLQGRVEREYPLSKLTTWQIGGPAEVCFWPTSKEDLIQAADRAASEGLSLHMLGKGSNILAPDEGVRGLVVVTTELKNIVWGKYAAQAECGCMLNGLALEASRRGWSGLEFAFGIPGTVGGGVRMNAGAYGREIADSLKSALIWRPGQEARRFERQELEFSYRSCLLEQDQWILEGEFYFTAGDKQKIRADMQDNLKKRKNEQPLRFPNAGSVFRNPPGESAGRLIESAGWKGKRLGGAMVSEQHANFIVNTGGAKARDVSALMKRIQEDVAAKFRIELTAEIHTITD
ncbi:MAG: UDP-N-acetylmuramate dehydrogenase [Peptococcaceae bacterium]|jgi:UDP-N-acetylmuramate dehydrogenase|nr:UDP-N-acetylmuramate dehydrogenase [Peptococcaceae bacterium]